LWEYINRSQTHECGNFYWDCGHAIPFLGIFVSNFWFWIIAVHDVACQNCQTKNVPFHPQRRMTKSEKEGMHWLPSTIDMGGGGVCNTTQGRFTISTKISGGGGGLHFSMSSFSVDKSVPRETKMGHKGLRFPGGGFLKLKPLFILK
jgi:hypothetical protein